MDVEVAPLPEKNAILNIMYISNWYWMLANLLQLATGGWRYIGTSPDDQPRSVTELDYCAVTSTAYNRLDLHMTDSQESYKFF